jgi:hypothetical protein
VGDAEKEKRKREKEKKDPKEIQMREIVQVDTLLRLMLPVTVKRICSNHLN